MPAPAKTKRNLVVSVSDVAFGGDGIARDEGKVIFVEGAVPGETVEIELLQDKKRFARGRVIKRLKAAPDAVAPFCPVFGSCGGCDWQNVPYEKQLDWKRSFITSALSKNAQLTLPGELEVWPSTRTAAYRNRVKLKAKIQGRFRFGYFAKGSHDWISIPSCPIADQPIQDWLKAAAALELPKDLRWQGECEPQVLADQSLLITFDPPLPSSALQVFQKAFPTARINAKGFHLWERDSEDYHTQSGQFQQVNQDGNRALRDWIRGKIAVIQPHTVLDLFCGSGNLSLGLTAEGRKVWGLEWSEKAIATAQENLRQNKLTGAVYKSGPAKDLRSIFPDLPDSIDCVITDPPRQGMDDSLDILIGLKARHILSVSCDPNTFARDLKGLMAAGYELVEIHGIDFFPQTYHVETIAHLIRRDS